MFLIRYLFSKSFLKNIFFIAVFLMVLLVSLLIFLNAFTRNNQSIEVPNLVGKSIIEFEKKLSEMDLKYMIVDTANFNPNFNIGSVLDQEPNAGAMVKGGRRLYLTLNSSDFKEIKLPKITGLTLRQARTVIESLGFIFGEIEYIDDIAFNVVLSISSNSIELTEGDFLKKTSTIDFKLGNGKK
jgi:beta-lactam-binding protein with PASTA domain